jgi:hypothetical protein
LISAPIFSVISMCCRIKKDFLLVKKDFLLVKKDFLLVKKDLIE